MESCPLPIRLPANLAMTSNFSAGGGISGRKAALMVYMNTGYLCHSDLSHLHLFERHRYSPAELWLSAWRIADPETSHIGSKLPNLTKLRLKGFVDLLKLIEAFFSTVVSDHQSLSIVGVHPKIRIR